MPLFLEVIYPYAKLCIISVGPRSWRIVCEAFIINIPQIVFMEKKVEIRALSIIISGKDN